MKLCSAKTLVAIVAVTTLAGCAFGRKYDYQTARPNISASTKDTIAVGVQDRRPYVVSGNKSETFVGLQRSGYGIPFDVNTASGQPLSQEIANALVNAFKFNQIAATPVSTTPLASREEILNSLLASGKPKAILLTLNEWKTDTLVNTDVHYNLRAEVFDNNGRSVASNQIQGIDELRGGANAHQAIEKKIEELFAGQVSAALQETPQVGQIIQKSQTSTGPLLSQQVQCKAANGALTVLSRLACSQANGSIVEK